jgi:hypothetical protein
VHDLNIKQWKKAKPKLFKILVQIDFDSIQKIKEIATNLQFKIKLEYNSFLAIKIII